MPVSSSQSASTAFDRDPQAAASLACLVRAYDRAIDACESFDRDGARYALSLLRSTLELDSPASKSFDALYAWCEESVDQRDFIGASQCLRSLRAAWHRATQPASPFPPFAQPGQFIC